MDQRRELEIAAPGEMGPASAASREAMEILPAKRGECTPIQ